MLILMSGSAWAQTSCENTFQFPSSPVTPNADGSFTSINGCNFWGDYTQAGGIVSGYEYQFTAEGYITVREGSVDGPVIGEGSDQISVTSTNGENLFIHWNADESCGSGSSCIVTSVICVSCATTPDCDGVVAGPALPGTPCDDGDETTYGDALTEDCECVGTVYDCVELMVNIGDACDDGDATTVDDTINADCECVGEPAAAGSVCSSAIQIDCNSAPATYSSDNSNGTNTTPCYMGDRGLWFSFIGTGNDITVNTTATFDHMLSINSGSCGDLIGIECQDASIYDENYTIESSVEGQTYYAYIAHYASESTTTGDITISITCQGIFDCPELEANIGDACDDGDEMTENDVITEDCDCVGTPVVAGDICGLENFDNAELPDSGYEDGSFVGNDGITWSYVQSRDENGDDNDSGIEGNAVMLRRVADDSKITSSTISGGISDFSVKLYKGFTGGGDRQVELFVNGDSYGLSDPFDDFDLHVFEVTGINIEGDIVIEIRNATSKQVIIDDITWTCGSSAYDCPEIEANVGDACDDGNPDTENDVITETCECVGTPIEEPGDYCEGEDVVFAEEGGIQNFKTVNGITNIDNQGIDNPTGYHDFTDMIVSQVAGASFMFIADIEDVGPFGDAGIAVYIDYNKNFEFESNPSELIYTTITFEATLTATVTIPENTDPGNYRLRIVSDGNALTPDPCNAKSSIHDYTVTVVAATYDCPELEANVGDACDDEDEMTENDVINAACECEGTPIVEYDCPELEANVGDACDDEDGVEGTLDQACDCITDVVNNTDDASDFNFTMYPNPVQDQLTVKAGEQIETITVYNLLGQVVINVKPNTLQTDLNTERLQAGVYLMKVTINGSVKTYKVVKK